MPAQSGMEGSQGAKNQRASLTVCQKLFSTVCTLNCTRKRKSINYSRAAFYSSLNTTSTEFCLLLNRRIQIGHSSVVIHVFSLLICFFVSFHVWAAVCGWVCPSVFVCIFMSLVHHTSYVSILIFSLCVFGPHFDVSSLGITFSMI